MIIIQDRLFENNYLNLLFNHDFCFSFNMNTDNVTFFGAHNILFDYMMLIFITFIFLGDFVLGCTITYNKTGLLILSKHRQQ